MDRTTDGAGPAAVDPSRASDQWESVLGSAMADSGIDPNAPLDQLDEPEATPPQSDPLESSAADPLAATPRVPTGDDGAETPAPADDPLSSAEAFTYPGVDGQPVALEGAFRIPGEGLYVPEDKVSHFQAIATKAETYERQVRDLTDQAQTFERLSSWNVRDANGQTRTLTGAPALEARTVALAETVATLRVIEDAINDPEKFQALVSPVQDADGNWYVVPNKQALAHLTRDAKLASMEAVGTVRTHLSALSAPPPPPPPSVATHAMPTIERLIADHGITGLSDADKQFLAGQFEPYVTPDRRVNPAFLDVMKDRAALRTAATQAVTTAATAGKFNTGMKAGLTTPKAPPKPSAPAVAAPPKKVGKAEQWDAVLQGALQDMAS